jgi:hypothetical protein
MNGREKMPEILITAVGAPTPECGTGDMTLRERINATDFESERFAANLIERIGWAVLDATELESRGPITGRETSGATKGRSTSGPTKRRATPPAASASQRAEPPREPAWA